MEVVLILDHRVAIKEDQIVESMTLFFSCVQNKKDKERAIIMFLQLFLKPLSVPIQSHDRAHSLQNNLTIMRTLFAHG
jgi:hypothetical protein